MNIYNKSSIIAFYKKHPTSKLALEIWHDEIINQTWQSPNSFKQFFGKKISILKNNRIVFDIKGNDYRLIASINYEQQWLFIKFIGTHADYDKINANTINQY
jgi:mRNA interferase HigB